MNESTIAIVGMACRYPDADTPEALWENAMAQRRAFRRLPPERLRLADYLGTKDGGAPDSTYAMQAALLTDWEFDRVAFRVAGGAYRAADLAHWLALEVAAGALLDAGFGDTLPQDTTGVLVGNTLTGEFSRANSLRLRWPYVRRVVGAALKRNGRAMAEQEAFLAALEAEYKSPFPAMNEESLAGGLSNTIAGRICNHFDLHGGGYTVDGACASSLLAVTTACSALVAGDLDVALAGGVDLSLDPFELVGFARAGALAADEMRVYDARSGGFWPGEGCGFVVLMRAADARKQGRRIYALLKGWGVSSDGSGGITRPEVEGQLLALRRAYARAGFGAETVGYFEGHGTGTAVGDAVEIEALSRARRESGDTRPAALGSIKANIGHTKAAAGLAGLIKATLAISNQILPPTTGCEEPASGLRGDAPALRVLREAETWPEGEPVRAGVSGMGFGGINTHVVLEGAEPNRKRTRLSSREQRLSGTPQDAELFLLAADTAEGLREQMARLMPVAERMSRAEMADLAETLARNAIASKSVRAALVSFRPEQLTASLRTLDGWLSGGKPCALDPAAGIFLACGNSGPRIGLLFPGQGTVPNLSGGALCQRFPVARDVLARSGVTPDADPRDTACAQPAIVAAEAAGLRVLADLGIAGDVAVGHSLGELTALHWAGVYDVSTLYRIAAARGRAMSEHGLPSGAMAALGADAETVEQLIDGLPVRGGLPVVIAGRNSPQQTVVSGEASGIARMIEEARRRGISARQLTVSHAFHSPLVAPAVPVLREALASERFDIPKGIVRSTISGGPLSPDSDLRALLCEQVCGPVRFVEAFAAAGPVDLWVEVGPGAVLAGLAGAMGDTPVISLDVSGPSLRGLLSACGAAFALGVPLKTECLFADRFVRPFRMDTAPRFLQNPCERAPLPDEEAAIPLCQPDAEGRREATASETAAPLSALETVRQVLIERTEFPADRIADDARMLSDLHLNSILVSQVVVEAARRYGVEPLVAPSEAADATVAQIAAAIEVAPRRNGASNPTDGFRLFPGLDTWVRAFTVEQVKASLPEPSPLVAAPSDWRVLGLPGCRMAGTLRDALATCAGRGIAVCLPPGREDECLDLLLAAAKEALDGPGETRLLVVQEGSCGAAAFVKSLHLETPSVPVTVVDVPFDVAATPQWVAREASALTGGFVEAAYDRDGERYTPVLRLLPESDGATSDYPVTADDVLLVTGGGKGITAECALDLARGTGSRLALMGRADPAADAGLRTNLERMAMLGVTFRYYAADVTNAEAVREAVAQARAELGPITGVLHGAGQNRPSRLADLSREDVERTLAPKVHGLRNVLAALDGEGLSLLLTFGSIIGRMGFRGNADYALANEWLRAETERFAREHPACRCRTLEWSVWAGVGMGERLGAADALLREGVVPISVEEGVRQFRHLVSASDVPASVVVTGRFGAPLTLTVAGGDALSMERPRFLEEVRAFYPGLELVADAHLSVATDPYLTDHAYQGELLLPGVLGLEAMAQAAMALVGAHCLPRFEGVTFRERVVVPQDGVVTLRVVAQVQGDSSVRVVLRSGATGFHMDHFGAVCRFEGPFTAEGTCPVAASEALRDASAACDLYGSVLFHGPRFRRVRGYHHLRARECVAEIGGPENGDGWFGAGLSAALRLGDPGARDAYLHAIQACLPHKILLPVGVGRIAIACPPLAAFPRFLRAREVTQDSGNSVSGSGDRYTYDLEVFGADGCLLERWDGLVLQAMAAARETPLPAGALLGPYLERRLEEWLPRDAVSLAALRTKNEAPRRECSDLALRRLFGENGASIVRRPDGKPVRTGADDSRTVSAAHSGGLTLVVAGEGSVACDVEAVRARPADSWRDMLGAERFSLAELLARTEGEGLDVAAARVWTAVECLVKAGMPPHAPLVRERSDGKGGILLSSGDKRIACLVVPTSGEGPGMRAVAVLVEAVDRAYEYRHIVSFEETNLVGNVYYTNHLLWQGRCREMFLHDHCPDVLAELRGGLALVTTGVSCRYLGELSAFDEIILRMRLASLTDSEISLTFEYLRAGDKGEGSSKEVIAHGGQQLACMRREGERLVPAPIPHSLRAALAPFRGTP